MATAEEEESQWDVKFREDEELEFFTELALHETERWLTAEVRRQRCDVIIMIVIQMDTCPIHLAVANMQLTSVPSLAVGSE
ncbi:hypothetical protein BaRGS_00010057 [Batillaria attramentaria]|uniref:Uncharacterized protein n=1 Tax=Batillaria attramentaria TaxID=370345 RepID=A0ABD0LGV2_9CAEN